MTGGRIRRILPYVQDDDAFCLTYGDGVGNVDITALLAFHRAQKTLCTLTAVQPPGRFGALAINQQQHITTFQEKPQGDGNWINGGFFVCSPSVIERIPADNTIWERDPMESLARDGQMSAFHHRGFWQPMDTLRDKVHLEELWATGKAPWRTW
jgi:glucose-1-phosphate cytidylyltransferase